MQSASVDVKLLYQTVEPEELRESVCVVIDILRATTSIVHALGHGAKIVCPCETIDQTDLKLKNYSHEQVLRGGERKGVTIDGFDLDNSPWSYTTKQIAQKVILFTTTNGTQAIAKCLLANHVFIGAFANFSAIANCVAQVEGPIHLVCAGTDGKLSLEDILFAGVLVNELKMKNPDLNIAQDDETTIALALADSVEPIETDRLEIFKISRGGQNLLELGMLRDLERAAMLDLYDIVPVWNPRTGEISVKS
jgi:2-phosphosulfolactate phosphatase